jgi:hypothetical protein
LNERVAEEGPQTDKARATAKAFIARQLKGWALKHSSSDQRQDDRSEQRRGFARIEPKMYVCWDNRICAHQAFNDYDDFRRELYRTTIAGEKPA